MLVTKFASSYGNRRFIIVFLRARHWILKWARWILFTPSQLSFLRQYFKIIFPSMSRESSSAFSGFPQEILYVFLIACMLHDPPIYRSLIPSFQYFLYEELGYELWKDSTDRLLTGWPGNLGSIPDPTWHFSFLLVVQLRTKRTSCLVSNMIMSSR
jgi:hypothetical protein